MSTRIKRNETPLRIFLGVLGLCTARPRGLRAAKNWLDQRPSMSPISQPVDPGATASYSDSQGSFFNRGKPRRRSARHTASPWRKRSNNVRLCHSRRRSEAP